MRKVHSLLFFILFLSLPYLSTPQDSTSSTADPVVINYISTIASSTSSTLAGSYQGGTALYIQGFGFDSTFENNVIYVGTTLCSTTAKGVTQNNIVCYTGAYTTGATSKLPVTIQVLNKQPYTCATTSCEFSYSTLQTPYLRSVYPKSSTGGQWINFYGVHRILTVGDGRDMGDVVGLYIGDSLCSLFDIEQGAINANANSLIRCSLTGTQEAGYYKVKEWVTPGIAQNGFKMNYASVLKPGTNYQFIVSPGVTGLNLHSGGSQGAELVISGTGFSANDQNIVVTVAGLPCAITSSTVNEITCTVGADTPGNTYGRYASNATSQVGGYISGSGLKYKRYEASKLTTKSMTGFTTTLYAAGSNEILFPIDSDNEITPSIYGDTETGDIFTEEVYGQVFKGYFLPPRTGEYVFRGLADDELRMTIADVTGSETLWSSTPARLTATSWSNSNHKTNYFYQDTASLKTAPISMTAGEAYYMEIYHISYQTSGFFKVAVEVPNTDVDAPNQVYEVQKVVFGQTVVPEILQFDITGGWNSGNIMFKMIILNPQTLQATYNVNGTINANSASAANFQSLLTKFAPFASYNPSVALTFLDKNGGSVATVDLAYTRRYTVTMSLFRPTTYTDVTTAYKFTYDYSNASNTVNTSSIPSVSSSVTQEHSPPIAGNYSISINNQKLTYLSNGEELSDIPYDTSPATLVTLFGNSLFQYKELQIDGRGNGYQNGFTFILQFVGVKGNLPDMVVDTTNMTGGQVGTSPTATVTTLRDGSTNLFVDPISVEFLGTAAATPQVIVSVNGAVSRCLDDCSYVVDAAKTPTLNSAVLTDNLLKLNITTDVAIGAFDIKFGGQTCTYSETDSNGLEEYVCALPYTTDVSSPLVEAGTHVPTVHIPTRGYADNSNTLNEVSYLLDVVSLSAATGDILGGKTVTMTGKGFPFTSAKTFSLKVCDVEAQIVSVANTEIKFITPPCTAQTTSAVLLFNTQTDNEAFEYVDGGLTALTLTAITPESHSPVLKGFMTITGTNFGTNVNDLTVWLQKAGVNAYQLNVIEATDTELKVRIPGAEQSDEFRVIVTRQGYGVAAVDPVDANIFNYEIVIESITPQTGSKNGGTILTITGRNFSPKDLENQVYVGNALNWNCDVISVTTTEIKCRTPPNNPTYTTLNQPVVVVGRAMIDSTCGGTTAADCQFTYDDTGFPTVAIASGVTTYKSGESVTLSGEHLVNGGVAPVVTVGGKVAEITSSSDTEIVFKFPALENGTYNLNVEVDKIGYAYPTIKVATLISVDSISPPEGSYIGNTIRIKGNGLGGLDSKYVSFNAVSSSATVPFNYTVRTDNTPDQFGIDFLGCASSGTITLNYYYKNTLYKNTYTCRTALTQLVTIPGTKVFAYSDASKVVTFSRTSLAANLPSTLYAYPIDANFQKIGDYISLTPVDVDTTFTADLAALPVGKYGFRSYYSDEGVGGADFKAYVEITQGSAPTLLANVDSGFGGGAQITVQGTGLGAFNQLLVAGIPAKLVTSSLTSLVYSVPPLVSATSQTEFKVAKESVLKGTPIADTATNKTNAFDKLVSTKYSSAAATCYIGQDFGASQQALITRIRYFPNPLWKSALAYIAGATIKASNDNTNWVTLATIDSTTHTGWNIWKPAAALTTAYRYVRFEHNSTSKCELAEFEVSGYLYAGTVASTAAETRDVTFTDGTHTTSFAGAVTYKASVTPVVTGVSPKYGSPTGNDELTLTGTGFGSVTANAQVLIDGIACTITAVTDTEIKCQTGARPVLPAANSFSVSISGNTATLKTHGFLYAHRWSDTLTWGGDFAPINGDTVYVPKGMVLLVDQTTPNLYLILVEGAIVFADETDMTVETTFLIVENGIFRAGTQSEPYQHKLTFILHGDYYDTQLPGFGNKVIGCHSCTFDMHGKARDHTWTEIAQTVAAGQTKIFLKQPVDWQVGEEIVIASTNFDHREAQQRTISAISGNKKQITFVKPLRYTHIGVTEAFGDNGDSIPIFAEVGLLTRNIKVQGDSYSERKMYGAHVMMHGLAENGLVGRISHTEFTHCGQPAIVGRYCMHFHMNGDVSNSFIKGNAVHHSFARVLTIHAVYYLTVEHNVGYSVRGHNIFLEDGIEQYNVIQYNLMISSLEAFNMLQTDISVASYWITNPLNTVRYNRAAGSDFYGFWYEIKKNPDGASATTDICPTGLPIGQSNNNIAHSNMRFGLRVFELFSSQNPCQPIRRADQNDPWLLNPSIQNKFHHYVLYRNAEDGLLAERIGNTIFENFVVADNARAGLEFYKTNYTKEPVIARNFVVVGRTENNGMDVGNFSKTSGLITSRTDGSAYENIRFYNFPAASTVITVGSKNEQMTLRATGCKNYNFSQISITNAEGNYIKYVYTRRYILHDLDGTLSGLIFDNQARASSTITPHYPHNEISGKCSNSTDQTKWDDSLICNAGTVVTDLQFAAAQPAAMFLNARIFVKRLTSDLQNYTQSDPAEITGSWVQKTDPEQMNTWGLPFVSGFTYSVYWLTGIDFTSLTMSPSFYFNPTSDAFIIRFNYTTHRELFDIGHIITNKIQTPLLTATGSMLTYSTCKFGEYYLDAENQYLFVCVSGKGKAIYDLLSVNGIACRFLCPKNGGNFTKETTLRYWSNATQWPGGVLPKAGDNVTVNGNWTIMLDIDVEGLDNLTIDGEVFLTEANRKLSANFIWVRYGTFNAGNVTHPFDYNFTLTLNGPKEARTYTVDPIVSVNKYLVVTGALNLYGKIPTTVTTRLTAIAAKGATSITVASAAGWVVGNTIGIAPSFAKSYEYESVTITAISGTTITFTPALNFTHYGDASPFTNSYGTIDMRSSVGLFDRNIKILRGADANGWGYGVLIYAWNDGTFVNAGAGVIRGVQFVNGGQYDTLNAALNIINTAAGTTNTIVTGSTFQHCGGYCFYFSNVNNATIDNNYVFVGKKFIAYAENVRLYNFTNNVLVAATNRSSMTGSLAGDDIACYSQYTALEWVNDFVHVDNNYCQGSDLTGFEIPHTPCQYLGSTTSSSFINNVAGTTDVGFLLSGGMDCAGGEKLRVYASKVGVVTNPKAKSFVWNNVVIADTARGIGLRFGGYDQNNNSMVWKNSYITAVSRPTCSVCYGSGAIPCSNMRAVRLLAATENTEVLPKIFGDSFQTICKAELFDSQVWIYDTTFQNYNTAYTGVLASKCSSNMLFESHPIDDSSIGNHHFFNTTCTNCDTNALGHYDPPIEKHFGWLGGCGNFPCSGRSNYIMYDHDGKLLGFKGIIIPNNTVIGNNTPLCTYNSVINGHICNRTDFARLKYTSIASDFDTRMTWPVNLTFEGGNYTTSTNGWREWQWDGDEPMNKRKGRFLSLVQLSKIYNMTFESQPPTDMLFSFSLPSWTGDNSQWVGIKIYYPIPNAISVTHSNGSATKSLLSTDTDNITNYVDRCGTNKYFYKNNTIHFIVTADSQCKVRVTLTSSVQVTARLSVSIDDFYGSNGITTFLDQMTAFLGIPTNRLKIVGVYSGSTIVDSVILPPATSTDDAGSAVPDDSSIVADLQTLAGRIATATPADLPGLPSFLGATATVNIMNVNGEAVIDNNVVTPAADNTKFIIIGVVVGVVGAVLIGLSIYLIVKKVRSRREILPEESSNNLGEEQSKDAIRPENRSEFELRNHMEGEPEQIQRAGK